MGRPIVYCGICGKSLKEDDFSKGRAHLVDNAPFCVTCRILPEPLAKPAPAAPPPPPPAPPRVSGAPSRALPPVTPRRHQPQVEDTSSSMGLLIGIGVVVLLIIIVVVILLSSGGPGPAPPALPTLPTPSAPTARAPDPVRPPPPRPQEDGQAAIRTLEALASSSPDPQAVLDRCEELKAKLRGTPFLSQLEAVEARALEARHARARDRQLTMSLENVQKLRDIDATFERRLEIENMLSAAMAVAGPRKAEVEKLLADYRKAAEAHAPRPPAGPESFDLEESGAIRNWLVLGPFGNGKARDAFQDHDFLKTEAEHTPAAGQEILTREETKVRWTPVSVPGGKVLLRTLEPLGLASKPAEPAVVFAACWLLADQDCQVKLRMQYDNGIIAWLDHRRVWKGYQEGWKNPEDAVAASLSRGPHLLLLKIGTPGGSDFGFRVRVLGLSAEPVAGLRVATEAK
jgi:hypothetical protein